MLIHSCDKLEFSTTVMLTIKCESYILVHELEIVSFGMYMQLCKYVIKHVERWFEMIYCLGNK